MAWPLTPLDVLVELYASGGWQDVTAYVDFASTIALTHGQPSGQQFEPQASRCALTLQDDDGRFSRRNPLGPYTLARSTPLRVSIRQVTDAFTRTSASGWGSADTGQAYSTGGAGGTVSPTDYSVDGDEGVLSVPASNAIRYCYLDGDGETYEDLDATVSFRLAVDNVTGGDVEAGIQFSGTSGANYHVAKVAISATEQGTLVLEHPPNAAVIASAALGGMPNLSTVPWFIRLQTEGAYLRAKAWSSAGAEPDTWAVSGQRLPTGLGAAGWPGLWTFVTTANTNTKPLLVMFDSFTIRRWRFVGQLAEDPLTILADPQDITKILLARRHVSAAGVLGQLELRKAPLPSAPRRWIERAIGGSVVLLAYWPMETGKLVDSAPAASSTAPPLRAWVGTHPTGGFVSVPPVWGSGDLAPWLSPVVSRARQNGQTVLAAKVPVAAVFAGQWVIDQVVAGNNMDGATDVNPTYLGGVLGWPQLAFEPLDGDGEVVINAFGLSAIAGSAPALFDGQPHHVRWSMTQVSANVAYDVRVDAVSVLSGTITSQTLPAIRSIGLVAEDGASYAQGHVAVWTTAPAVADAVDAAFGHAGEIAGLRIERLCIEQGIDLLVHGDLDDTAACGPQHARPLLDELRAAADATLGQIHDARSGGLMFRVGSSIYNQDDTATLDYTARGHIAHMVAVEDDRIVNNAQVTREYGLTSEYQRDDGPLGVDAVGLRDISVTASLHADEQGLQLASQLVHLGTWDGARYAPVTIRQHALAGVEDGVTLAQAVADLSVADRLAVTNPPSLHWGPSAVDQLVIGYTETLAGTLWTIDLNCVPAGPYDVFTFDDATLGRLHLDGQTVNTTAMSDAGTLSVATAAGKPLVTTDAADMPMRITVAGAVLDVTAVSGASSPQTFTTTLINGVVKSLPAGEPVELTSQHALAY